MHWTVINAEAKKENESQHTSMLQQTIRNEKRKAQLTDRAPNNNTSQSVMSDCGSGLGWQIVTRIIMIHGSR